MRRSLLTSRLVLAPTFIDATFYSNTTGQAVMAPIIPTGTGKLWLMLASNNATAQYTKDAPANGWALASSVDGTSALDTTVRGMALWAHPGDGSEGVAGATVPFTRTTNTTGLCMAIMVRVSGAVSLQSIRLSSGSGATTINLASRDSVAPNTLALQLVTYATSGAGDWTEPVGTTPNEEGQSAGTTWMAVGSDVVGIGASGDRTWGRSSSGSSRGAMLLLNAA